MEHQIELLASDPNLSALWHIKFFSKYSNPGLHFGIYIFEAQGTTLNEALHALLDSSLPYNIARSTLETLEMQIGVAVFDYNRR